MTQECIIPTTDTPKLPPIVCAPWCEDGDGHVSAIHPDDQHCYVFGGPEIELHREAPLQIDPEGPYYRPGLNLTLWQEPFSEPYVELHVDGMGGGVKLTIDEVERAVQGALHLVAVARGEATEA